jgi:hypothetical protein
MKPKNAFVERFGAEIGRDPNIKPATLILTKHVPREQTAAMIAACKKNKVTFMSAFQTAANIAMFSILREGSPTKKLTVQSEYLISFKSRLLGLPDTAIGNYMVKGDSSCKLDDHLVKDFWKIAKETKSNIDKAVTYDNLLEEVQKFAVFLGLLCRPENQNIMDAALSGNGECAPSLFTSSNLGNLNSMNSLADPQVKVHGIFNQGNQPYAGPLHNIGLVSVDGRLCCTMTYFQHISNREISSKFFEKIFDVLLENCTSR